MSQTLESTAAEKINAVLPVNHRQVLAGAVVTAAITLSFFLLYWNRFVALRSGDWLFSFGMALLDGKVPCRDYFCTSPPLSILKSALVLKLFGAKLIVLRAFAVFERVLLASILYFWLARFFRPATASLAAVVAIIVASGDVADTFTSYSHDAILWTVAAGFCASFALDGRRARALLGIGALTGLCTGLALCTKQSIGGGAFGGIPVVCAVLLWRRDGLRQAAMFLAGYAGGCVIPTGALLAWLASLGTAGSFLTGAFVRGPAAKNLGGNQFLLRSLAVAAQYWRPAILAFVTLPFIWKVTRKSDDAEMRGATNSFTGMIMTLIVSAAAIATGAILAYRGTGALPLLVKAAIYSVYIGCPALGIYYGWRLLQSSLSRRQAQYCLLAAVSFFVAFTVSLSWPAYETMLLPGAGFLVAAAMDAPGFRSRSIAVAVAGILICAETCTRLEAPEGFEDFIERPVREATMRSSLPEMSGFLLPPGMVRLLDETVRIVRENTKDGDNIFTYPGLGLLYTLTGREWPTVSGEENVDLVNDAFAGEEAWRLLNARPKVIIYYRQPEEYIKGQEFWWRGGRRLGQRDIIAAIEKLIQNYRLAATFAGPSFDRTILVYVRP